MVNLLQIIINYHGKLIGNYPVFAFHNKIAILLGEVMGKQALQFILKGNAAVIDFNAQCMRAIRRDLLISANAGVNIGQCLSSIADSQRFSAACARINKPTSLQVADNIVISVDMSALIINVTVPMQA